MEKRGRKGGEKRRGGGRERGGEDIMGVLVLVMVVGDIFSKHFGFSFVIRVGTSGHS